MYLFRSFFIHCFTSLQPTNCAASRLTCWSSNLANFISEFEMYTTQQVWSFVAVCSVWGLSVSTVWLQQGSRTQTWWPALAAQRARPATTGLCLSLNTAFSVSFHHITDCTVGRYKGRKMAVIWFLSNSVVFSYFWNHMLSNISLWLSSMITCPLSIVLCYFLYCSL